MVKAYGVISKGNGEVILTEERHTSLSVGGASRTRIPLRDGNGYAKTNRND